jgi:hypothetical protein
LLFKLDDASFKLGDAFFSPFLPLFELISITRADDRLLILVFAELVTSRTRETGLLAITFYLTQAIR